MTDKKIVVKQLVRQADKLLRRAEKISKDEPNRELEKELATKRGEPWIAIVHFEVDPKTPHAGEFELDWNEHFVRQLQKYGYEGRDDDNIIENWFRDLCRHIVLESHEQEEAALGVNNMVTRNRLDDDRVEIG